MSIRMWYRCVFIDMRRFIFLLTIMCMAVVSPLFARASEGSEGGEISPKEIIFEHLGDG